MGSSKLDCSGGCCCGGRWGEVSAVDCNFLLQALQPKSHAPNHLLHMSLFTYPLSRLGCRGKQLRCVHSRSKGPLIQRRNRSKANGVSVLRWHFFNHGRHRSVACSLMMDETVHRQPGFDRLCGLHASASGWACGTCSLCQTCHKDATGERKAALAAAWDAWRSAEPVVSHILAR